MTRIGRYVAAALTTVVSLLLLLAGATTAWADASGSIDQVESRDGTVQVLFSVEGLPKSVQPDLSSVGVTLDGTAVKAEATPASLSSGQIRRTAVLVIDSSQSMRGKAFDEAQSAALAFAAQAPANVQIGLVSFAGTVDVVQQPTTDRAALRSGVNGLQLSSETHLYEGVLAALRTAGTEGQRRILVLSDGRDTTGGALKDVTVAVGDSGAQVDVVALSQSPDDVAALTQIADSGQGALVSADDPSALTALFADEAQALANQVLVSFTVPSDKAGSDADLVVSIGAGGTTYTDDAFVSLGTAPAVAPTIPVTTSPADKATLAVSRPVMLAAVAAIGVAILLVLASIFGVFHPKETVTLEDRLAGYGDGRGSSVPVAREAAPKNVRESALGWTKKAIGSGGFEAKLSRKLDSAGLSLKPAEWVLLHIGLAFAAAAVGFLLTSGKLPLTLLLFVFGVIVPWVYLGIKESRRLKAFNAQLSETLQLMAGGLKAGLSLAQSVDTIVREGTEPMATEFRRALVEARLGVNIEDALEGVADRMSSEDFRWVVMAIRIQREVGGNLAELMLNVAATLREREYLRRQVLTLSAEGRLSAWILGGLPPAFLAFLVLAQGDYVAPMFDTAIGWAMLAFAAILLAVGSFWMSRVVKVEV